MLFMLFYTVVEEGILACSLYFQSFRVEPGFIRCICVVGKYVWCADTVGIIHIYR